MQEPVIIALFVTLQSSEASNHAGKSGQLSAVSNQLQKKNAVFRAESWSLTAISLHHREVIANREVKRFFREFFLLLFINAEVFHLQKKVARVASS